jgi:predicted short-subunit dehydrogenase-like oxidoreductase (DUF2520 family)
MKTPPLERLSEQTMSARSRDHGRRPDKQKPSIAIVGAGRLGTWLGYKLAARGYPVSAIVTRSSASARRALRLINSVSSPPSQTIMTLAATKLNELPNSIDLFLITTPDHEIKRAATRLAKTINKHRTDKPVALHASGALTSDELEVLREKGFSVGSLHPLLSVSNSSLKHDDSNGGAFFCIEGDAKAARTASKIVRDLGGHSFSISAERKALYHAAAVTTSGHTVALFDIAVEMFSRCGLTEAESRRALLPLLRSTLENLSAAQTNAEALTGTFARADVQTARKHLAAMTKEKNLDEAQMVYTLLGKRSLQLAAQNKISRVELRKVARVLDEALFDGKK